MSIPEALERGKGAGRRIPADLLITLILLLSCTAAFGFGYLYGREEGKGSGDDRLWIEELSTAEPTLQAAAAAAPQPAPVPGAGKYVGSRNGTKYHLPDCPGAGRIKESNRVWFGSKQEAEAAGYTPAANCPDI